MTKPARAGRELGMRAARPRDASHGPTADSGAPFSRRLYEPAAAAKRRVQMASRADRIADAVIAQFERLPPKRKPAVRDNGVVEWVPLSGIVAEEDGAFTCLALA
ncbi:hypothetical protein CDD83_11028 [Cordyceps sp. RAO-2017]|nr:hypothetical protein CDD83_11028 [Cordyceps sp. RAO-2017]